MLGRRRPWHGAHPSTLRGSCSRLLVHSCRRRGMGRSRQVRAPRQAVQRQSAREGSASGATEGWRMALQYIQLEKGMLRTSLIPVRAAPWMGPWPVRRHPAQQRVGWR